MSDVLTRERRMVGKRIGDVTLNLPFVSFSVNPKDREIVIRLKDRRVLSAWECCETSLSV